MFKKTLAAAAVLGAFAGSAFAADVTLYGLVDYGFNYVETDKGVGPSDSTFTMESGTNSGSRFGLKGTEDLGNGLTVGFNLENGFSGDNGALGQDGRLFGRESSLFVQGDFGTLRFGRTGALASGFGPSGIFGGAVSPFSTGWNTARGHKAVMMGGFGTYDNTIAYVSPSFAGFQVHAQYSLKGDAVKGSGDEGKSNADRYAALGATYKAGAFNAVAIVEQQNYSNAGQEHGKDVDDALAVMFGGAYDFQVAKVYAAAQYFDDYKKMAVGYINAYDAEENKTGVEQGALKGYGLNLGVSAPVMGGTAKFNVGYMDAEQAAESNNEFTRYTVTAGYDYNLSKRTSLYTAVGYTQDSYDYKGKDYEDADTLGFVAGMIHKF